MMSAEINIRRQAGMLIRRPILVDKLPLSVSVHYGLDIACGVAYLVSLSAIADFQDYTISIAAEARPIQGHRSSASARRPTSVILTRANFQRVHLRPRAWLFGRARPARRL